MTGFTKLSLLKRKLNDLFKRLHSSDSIVPLPIHVSIGISVVPWDGDTFDVLYRKADIALYRAKKEGKNNWRVYQNKIKKKLYHQDKKAGGEGA